eukprot:170760-Chlamydomonas_euryale.AAC.1
MPNLCTLALNNNPSLACSLPLLIAFIHTHPHTPACLCPSLHQCSLPPCTAHTHGPAWFKGVRVGVGVQ